MKKKTLSISGISALGLALIGSAAVNAYAGPSGQNNTSMTVRNFNQERHTEMQKLLDTTDFQTWKDLMSKNPRSAKLLEVINESNFFKFIKMQKLLLSGDRAGAEAIRVKLGLPEIGPKNGTMGRNHFDKGQNDVVRTAIENSDYNAWKEAIANTPMSDTLLSKITESNFSQFVEMHKLMQTGDKSGAEAIEQNLGLERPFAMNHGPMMRGGRNHKTTSIQTQK